MEENQVSIYEARLNEVFLPMEVKLVKQLGETMLEAGMQYVGDMDFNRMISPSYIEPGLQTALDKEKQAGIV